MRAAQKNKGIYVKDMLPKINYLKLVLGTSSNPGQIVNAIVILLRISNSLRYGCIYSRYETTNAIVMPLNLLNSQRYVVLF